LIEILPTLLFRCFPAVAVIEMIGLPYRTCASSFYFSSMAVGYTLQPAVAFLLPDEFWYQVAALSLPFLFPLAIMYVTSLSSSVRLYLDLAKKLSLT